MSTFKFIHAADLHLDSPLTGLSAKSESYARRIDDASRAAFSRMIRLAIDEECAFVLIPGDLFDGQWRDYRTGLYFAAQMRLLSEAGIGVYIILGNHDAENKFVNRLQLTANVTLFSSKAPHTHLIESLGVAIHGQSFPTRDVSDNLAARYPSPVAGYLNIGMLHTALDGREGHALYAPCTVEQLKNHGYDYWALGHVHDFSDESGSKSAPFIVYSGVLQGRHIREAGPKGVVLVSVRDSSVESLRHVPLDSVRWQTISINVSTAADLEAVVTLTRSRIIDELAAAEDRSLALRIDLMGSTPLHGLLAASRSEMREMLETAAAGVSGDVWIEKLVLSTVDVSHGQPDETIDPSIAGSIREHIRRRADSDAYSLHVSKVVDEIKNKLPAGAGDEAFYEVLKIEAAAAARALALATLDSRPE